MISDKSSDIFLCVNELIRLQKQNQFPYHLTKEEIQKEKDCRCSYHFYDFSKL